jgi:hypothetical protein
VPVKAVPDAAVPLITTGVAGPLETTRATAEPLATLLLATGLSLITSPEATVLLDCMVTAPTASPAPVTALVAAACVSPTTFGTLTVELPPDPPPQAVNPNPARASMKPLIDMRLLILAPSAIRKIIVTSAPAVPCPMTAAELSGWRRSPVNQQNLKSVLIIHEL